MLREYLLRYLHAVTLNIPHCLCADVIPSHNMYTVSSGCPLDFLGLNESNLL